MFFAFSIAAAIIAILMCGAFYKQHLVLALLLASILCFMGSMEAHLHVATTWSSTYLIMGSVIFVVSSAVVHLAAKAKVKRDERRGTKTTKQAAKGVVKSPSREYGTLEDLELEHQNP
jgi:hypothetical protein